MTTPQPAVPAATTTATTTTATATATATVTATAAAATSSGTAPARVPSPRVRNAVLGVAPAEPAVAAAYFAASLACHTDVSDVAAALADGGDPGFTLVDTRSTRAWDQGRIPGAVHLPTALIPDLAPTLLDRARPVVVHCWGPGCNGAARAALALAALGYRVKEMLGGIEYWMREGLAYETADGPARQAPDPRTAPVAAADCGC